MMRQKKYDKAIAAFDRALELNANNDDVLANKGTVYIQKVEEDIKNSKCDTCNGKDHSKAIDSITNALKINPDNVVANYSMAYLLHWTARFEEALFFMDKVISIKPEFEQAYKLKQECLSKIK